jgi:hypothetical protein
LITLSAEVEEQSRDIQLAECALMFPPRDSLGPVNITRWRSHSIPGTQAGRRNAPLYAARIEDLGPGDFVKVDCAACHHVALLTPETLLRAGLSPAAKLLDIKGRLRCRGCGRKGRAVVSIRWR